MAMLPRRSAPYLFAFILSGFMTLVVSGVVTLIALEGFNDTMTVTAYAICA